MMKRTSIGVLLVASLGAASCAGVDLGAISDAMGVALPQTGGSESRVAEGLREALKVGTDRAVTSTSRPGGYLENRLIRIVLPDQLETIGSGLRTIGMGSKVDELEVAMNTAAEKASAEAKPIFWDAIRGMTLTDAKEILAGKPTAATSYLRRETGDTLGARFKPIVKTSMERVGVYQRYESVAGAARKLPFVDSPSLDLTEYVTDKGLDGLFTMLGKEEARIRKDPAARTTELLRDVFGNR